MFDKNHSKKRGRPTSDPITNIIDHISSNKSPINIVLNLKITQSDIDQLKSQPIIPQPISKNDIFIISDISDSTETNNYTDSYERIDTSTKILELEEKVKDLEEINLEYKKMLSIDSEDITNNITMLNIRFINTSTGNQEIIEKTDIACWWCTYKYDTMPCFLTEKMIENTFYVFGNFCSYNCAASYNLDLNDYRVWERHSLLKKLYNLIYNTTKDIIPAPRKECLKRYGGPLTIEEYRRSLLTNIKEYRFIMPPMKAIIPFIEENNNKIVLIKKKYSNNSTVSDSLVLKRSKPLQNAKTDILKSLTK